MLTVLSGWKTFFRWLRSVCWWFQQAVIQLNGISLKTCLPGDWLAWCILLIGRTSTSLFYNVRVWNLRSYQPGSSHRFIKKTDSFKVYGRAMDWYENCSFWYCRICAAGCPIRAKNSKIFSDAVKSDNVPNACTVISKDTLKSVAKQIVFEGELSRNVMVFRLQGDYKKIRGRLQVEETKEVSSKID